MTLWQLIKTELRSVMTNPVVVLTVFGGVVFYSFLYPLPYAQQTPREQIDESLCCNNIALTRR